MLGSLDPKKASNAVKFMQSMEKVGAADKKKLSNSVSNFKVISQISAILIGAIAILAVLTMINMKALLVGTGTALLILAGVVTAVLFLSKNDKDIKGGYKGLENINKTIMILAVAMMGLGLIAALDLVALGAAVVAVGIILMKIVKLL